MIEKFLSNCRERLAPRPLGRLIFGLAIGAVGGVIAEHFGLSAVDSELFFHHSLNITKTIFLFYRRGQLSKAEAARSAALH